MGTRSTITVKYTDEKNEQRYRTIYCHWDGYISHNGQILFDHYKDHKKVMELVNLGALSSLAPEWDSPINHTFQNPVKGFCVYYGRDRGELNCKYKDFHDIGFIDRQEFNYLFEDDKWKVLCSEFDGTASWKDLQQVIKDEESE